jgi:hypothetical protein
MYIPLFMFNGKHTVQYDEREKLFLVKLEVAFRNRLAPGEFPYPFWHSADKWNTYQGANNVLLRFDPKTAKVKIAQFTDRGATAPIVRPTTSIRQVRRPVDVDRLARRHAAAGRFRWSVPQGQPVSAEPRCHIAPSP